MSEAKDVEEAKPLVRHSPHPLLRYSMRWLIFLLLMPLLAAAGYWLSAWLGYLFGLWQQAVAAVVLPLLLLSSSYMLAPHIKRLTCLATALLVFFLAFHYAYPSYYPEWHSRAYQVSYLPMRLFCITEIVVLMPMIWPSFIAFTHWLSKSFQQLSKAGLGRRLWLLFKRWTDL